MACNDEESMNLKNEIAMKLNDTSLTEDEKKQATHLNNKIAGQHALQLRKMLRAFLNNNSDFIMNRLEEFISNEKQDPLLPNETRIIEKIIQLYKACVLSYITKNEFHNLRTVLYYCNVYNSFFASIFTQICCIGHKDCLSTALKRISNMKGWDLPSKNKPAAPFAGLFDTNFYRQIVEHDRIFLIETMFAHKQKITWNVPLMKELARKGNYKKVEAYLENPESYQAIKISDSRVDKLDYNNRKILADEIKKAVKDSDAIKLEQCLQDLVACKRRYNNVDNLLNETITEEGGTWKGERLMHWACKEGNLLICKALYKKGASLRVLDVNFHTPAHVAIEANHLHVLQWLHKCDEYLIRDFFEHGWKDPLLHNYLFQVKDNNENLPVLEYLLFLGCDQILPENNIEDVLENAITGWYGDYTCIDALLKGEEVCKRITPDHIKDAAKRNDQLLSKLLAAASLDCIEKLMEEDKAKEKKKRFYEKWKRTILKALPGICNTAKQENPFYKQWKKRCPEALPEIFSKFVPRDDEHKIIRPITVCGNGKLIFKEISKLKKVQLLNNSTVSSYMDDNLYTIWPYYIGDILLFPELFRLIDIFFISIHLFCISLFCVSYGSRDAPNGKDDDQFCYIIIRPLSWVWNLMLKYNHVGFLVVNITLSLKQLIELCIKRSRFLNRQDVVETISYAFSFAVLALQNVQSSWNLVIIIICLFISWMDLFMKLMVVPWQLGLYIEMFYSILKRFIRVALMFMMFLVCFTTAFYTLFHRAEPFRSFHSVVGKTLAMMTGEFDFDELFFSKNDGPSLIAASLHPTNINPTTTFSYLESTISEGPPSTQIPNITHPSEICKTEYPSLLAYYVFFAFCICLHILLLNLLNALAVDDIKNLMEDSKGRRTRKQAELIASLDRFWKFVEKRCGWIKCCCNCCTCCNGKPLSDVEQGTTIPEVPKEKDPLLTSQNSQNGITPTSYAYEMTPMTASVQNPDVNLETVPVNHEVIEETRPGNQEEVAESLDLMQEVVFLLEKRNRDLTSIIKNMEQRMEKMQTENREMKEEMKNWATEILARLPESNPLE